MTGPLPDQDPTVASMARLYDRPPRPMISGVEIIAGGLSAIWIVAALVFYTYGTPDGTSSTDGLQTVMMVLAIIMPLMMIWVAAMIARSSKVMREESQRLQAAIDGIRSAYVAQQQNATAAEAPLVSKKLDEIAEATRKTETALATFQTSRRDSQRTAIPTPTSAELPEDQGLLALGTSAEDMAAPLPVNEFVRAMNFPETAEDEEGFAALRRALQDRKAAQVIQAAQDVLTLLSQDGIYMDDLRPDMARPEIWRQFARGTRGRAVASLGGVRDRTSLALTSARMKQDPIFRDAAHHFLRRFDQMFSDFETEATDTEISALSETRTARAFMLLGRVAGTFD